MPDKPLDMEAVRKREQAATPGPWQTSVDVLHARDGQKLERYRLFARHKRLGDGVEAFDESKNKQAQRNGEFIAHARDDIPALIAEVDRLTTERNSYKINATVYEKRVAELEAILRGIERARDAHIAELEAEIAKLRGDLEQERRLSLNLSETFKNARTVRAVTCAECNGDGVVQRSFGLVPCPACEGKGH